MKTHHYLLIAVVAIVALYLWYRHNGGSLMPQGTTGGM